MSWIDVKREQPDIGDKVLTLVPRMGENGENEILVAQFNGDNEWYSGFPKDQPVEPTHWSYSITIEET